MEYYHRQTGWLHWLLYGMAAGAVVLMWFERDQAHVVPATSLVALLLVFAGLAFHHLTVSDEGDALAVRFGPLPLFGTRIRYAEITAAEPSQTSIIDGWGVHYIPGRGWTYNLWGLVVHACSWAIASYGSAPTTSTTWSVSCGARCAPRWREEKARHGRNPVAARRKPSGFVSKFIYHRTARAVPLRVIDPSYALNPKNGNGRE